MRDLDKKTEPSFLVFLIRFILFFNVYAYLFLFLSVSAFWASCFFWKLLSSGWRWVAVLVLSGIGLFALFEAVLITAGFPRKWKFYRLTARRLDKHGFREEYFRMGMYEPCMRLLSRDLLKRFQALSHYKQLKEKYGKKNQEVERRKEALAKSLGLEDPTLLDFEEVKNR